VCKILQDDDDPSGSTAVIALYDGRRHMLTVANIGDSMCVLSRGGRAVKMHKTHRLKDEQEECKRVEAAGGTIKNHR
jgi:serine/threonine protein phosphatase PrpC